MEKAENTTHSQNKGELTWNKNGINMVRKCAVKISKKEMLSLVHVGKPNIEF